MTNNDYSGNNYRYNRTKLSTQQQRKIMLEACKQARSDMIPNNGGINLAYDGASNSWLAQYVIETPLGRQQLGWSGSGYTAIAAIRDLERNNFPHPWTIQAQWEAQDKTGNGAEQPNKLN